MECPICYETTNNMENLECSHSMCSTCLTSLINSNLNLNCPFCRQDIQIQLSLERMNLIDSVPKKINLSIQSSKGTSSPMNHHEKRVLSSLFGNLVTISNLSELENYYNRRVLIQIHSGNSWFSGYLSDIQSNKIMIKKCVFIQRSNGSIYNTSPPNRTINIANSDLLFVV